MKPNPVPMEAIQEFIQPYLLRGDEPYMLTLMFKTLKGSEESIARQMNKVAEILYSRILTRLIKRPNRTPLEQMPLWLSCPDWPVMKIDGLTAAEILANGGRHLHAMVLVPPTARTGKRLDQIVEENPQQFLVGRSLTRLHVMPVERTVERATGYALKSVERGRVGWGDVLVLPKAHSEMEQAVPVTRLKETEADFIARIVSWSNGL